MKCKHGVDLGGFASCMYCIAKMEPPNGCVNPRMDDPNWLVVQEEAERVITEQLRGTNIVFNEDKLEKQPDGTYRLRPDA